MGVYLMSVHLISMHLISGYFISLHLRGHLRGVPLMGVYLVSVHHMSETYSRGLTSVYFVGGFCDFDFQEFLKSPSGSPCHSVVSRGAMSAHSHPKRSLGLRGGERVCKVFHRVTVRCPAVGSRSRRVWAGWLMDIHAAQFRGESRFG